MSQAVCERIQRALRERSVLFEILEHAPVFTSEEAAHVRGVPLRAGVKALCCRTRDGKFIMVLVRGDNRADLEKIAQLEGTGRVWLASQQEVLQATDCETGAVPPFGFSDALKTYMDRTILENRYVEFNAGLHTVSIKMSPGDLEKAIKPVLF